MAAILIVTGGVAVVTAAPANALWTYSQGFEREQPSEWYGGLIGRGSMEWSANLCGQARTGCGAAILRHFSPTGYTSTFTTLHIDSFVDSGLYGYCGIAYYAKRWNSSVPVTARLELINPNGSVFMTTDRVLTNSNWTNVGIGFYQFGARDFYVKITLPSPGNSNDVGFLADDLKLFCQVLLQ
ncbi:hypothetical protein OHA72_49045 [Dactylosporangium sp. NBC_01737]|uniref:hypothetical protein n=1 Tax=Dactylosporangium sp. NBC_01737 TaxID=2975959 RepID=UPI002E0EC967|nr:hypothetical protein OHA72_49045 [Dactylosporangium sp. NBC_01737]